MTLCPKCKKIDYPNWVCQECGRKASKGKQFYISTWHKDKCGVCGKIKSVTEPRDFYYPKFEVAEIKQKIEREGKGNEDK